MSNQNRKADLVEDEDSKQFSEIAENLKKSSNMDYNSIPRTKKDSHIRIVKNQGSSFRRQGVSQSRASSQQSQYDNRTGDCDDSN